LALIVLAAQGFFAAHGFAAFVPVVCAAQGFLAAHGFPAKTGIATPSATAPNTILALRTPVFMV